ncbi:10634_t:CDS:2 [Gigaspora margarita]|uniref:10634_t:CDS:1 n=1 Tax=Gigaspora margarita TaxID=4874 RepID=A0ABN7V262_GIGMA|nr:10634_t:CDS:2 [Gigaspora margarita]
MSSNKHKDKTTLTNKQRQDIIAHKSKNPNISNVDLAEWVKKEFKLDVHPTTIGRLIKNKDDIGSNPFTKRQRTIQHPELENSLLDDAIIVEKAKAFTQILQIPDLKFSQGWLYKFKNRHGLGRVKKYREDASVDENIIAVAIPKLKDLEPDTTLATVRLKGVNRNRLGITYVASGKAWMTTVLFQTWLKEFDTTMASRKVILLVDGAKTHSTSNLTLHNTTNYFIKWLLDQYEARKDEKMNVLTAIKFINRAWKEVLSEMIRNCFQHTGILPDAQDNEELPIDDNNDNLMNELYKDIEALNFLNVMDLEEYIDYPGEKDTHEVLSDQEILDLTTNIESAENECSENEDDSTEMCEIGHQEALNAIEILEQYIVQKDFGKTARFEHNEALSKLQKEIRKLRIAAFKQTSIEIYFESA